MPRVTVRSAGVAVSCGGMSQMSVTCTCWDILLPASFLIWPLPWPELSRGQERTAPGSVPLRARAGGTPRFLVQEPGAAVLRPTATPGITDRPVPPPPPLRASALARRFGGHPGPGHALCPESSSGSGLCYEAPVHPDPLHGARGRVRGCAAMTETAGNGSQAARGGGGDGY